MSINAEYNRKRKRLTFACNACRSRKVKCDDGHPKCTKCARAGIECITIDPRQPGSIVLRREAQHTSTPPRITPSTTDHTSVSGDQYSPAPLRNPSIATSQHRIRNEAPTEGYEIAQPHDTYEGLQIVSPGPTDNAPLPTWPRFMSGNNLQVMSQWLDLAFARIGVRHGFSSFHNIGAPDQKVSRLSPYALSSLSTHAESEIKGFAQMFLCSANTIFPVFEERTIHQITSRYSAATAQGSLEPYPCSETAIAILTIAIAKICGEADTGEALKHIRAAYSMLSVIVVESSLRSTQALFLLALALRAFNEIEMAWHLITLGISIAQSSAMHRAYTAQKKTALGESLYEEHLRTWWAIYSLEKAISLEVERPSSLRGPECNQILPKCDGGLDFLHVIALAQIQHQVNERCIQARSSEENPEVDYHDVIREKIVSAGELDQMLLTWADTLPHNLRPSNYLYCEPESLLLVSYLAIQYYQTLVLIHRNALLININNVRKEADYFCSDKPYKNRIRNGHAVCADAARSIVGVLEATQHLRTCLPLHAIYAPLLATYALAVHTLKHPFYGPAKADFELEVRAIEFVRRKQDMAKDTDPHLETLLVALQSQVSAVVKSAASTDIRTPTRHSTGSSDAVPIGGSQVAPAPVGVRMQQNYEHGRIAQLPHGGHTFGAPDIPGWTGGLSDTWPDNIGQDFDFVTSGFDLGDLGNMNWDALAATLDLPS